MGYEIMVSGIKDLVRWYMKFVVQSHLETPLASPSFETIPLDNISGLKLCNSSGTLCGRVLGSLLSEGVGPICLGPKSVTLKKRNKEKLGKDTPKTLLLYTSSRAQNLISTIQLVAIRVSNLSSKFQLDWTTNETESTC